MSKSLIIYRGDVKKASSPLSPDDEMILAQKVREGDMKAREEFILANMKFVQFVAKKYIGCGIPLEDIIQEGNIGMIYAVDNFDHTRGFKFITYAVKCIKGFISHAIANNGNTVRNPQHISKPYYKIQQAEHKLTGDLGCKPTTAQIAKELDLSPKDVENLILSYTKTHALDETLPIRDDQDISKFYKEDDTQFLTERLESAVELLADVHSDVLTYRLGLFGREKMKPFNIAKRMGLREAVIYVLIKEALGYLEEVL